MTRQNNREALALIVGIATLEQENVLLRGEVEKLESLLAFCETQIGFGPACGAHGFMYSENCGACSISERIARLCPPADPPPAS